MQDSDELEDMVESQHDGLLAYIVIGCDQNNENFVACNFAPDQSLAMAELLFLLISGGVVEESMSSLKQACDTQEELTSIVKILTELMRTHSEAARKERDDPVVDPTEVFSRKDSRDFKG